MSDITQETAEGLLADAGISGEDALPIALDSLIIMVATARSKEGLEQSEAMLAIHGRVAEQSESITQAMLYDAIGRLLQFSPDQVLYASEERMARISKVAQQAKADGLL